MLERPAAIDYCFHGSKTPLRCYAEIVLPQQWLEETLKNCGGCGCYVPTSLKPVCMGCDRVMYGHFQTYHFLAITSCIPVDVPLILLYSFTKYGKSLASMPHGQYISVLKVKLEFLLDFGFVPEHRRVMIWFLHHIIPQQHFAGITTASAIA